MLKNVVTISVLALFVSPQLAKAQIDVNASCGEVSFGSTCTFTASGSLGNINWIVSGGEWNWVEPRNPGPHYNINTTNTQMTAICRRYPAWNKQNMTVTINSMGYSKSISIPYACYGPQLGESSITCKPASTLLPASAIATAKFGNAYGSIIPGRGEFVYYPNGWQYLDHGTWKNLVTQHTPTGGFGNPDTTRGIKMFVFMNCLFLDSTPWDSSVSVLHIKTIPIDFKGLTIRKWVERCEGEMTYGSPLEIPAENTLHQQNVNTPVIYAWVKINANGEMNVRISDPNWSLASVITLTGQSLSWEKTGEWFTIGGTSSPGAIRLAVSNGNKTQWINPFWIR